MENVRLICYGFLIKILWAILLLIPFQVSSQQTAFREFSQELSQPFVYSINQDVNGYLWVGTGNGLTRYDGINFRNYSVSDSIADNFISCSFANNDGIWFGHMNGNLTFYNGHKFSIIKGFGKNSGITDIKQNSAGEVWASSFQNGFMRPDKNVKQEKRGPLNQLPVYAFEFLNNEEVLIGSVNGLIYARLHKNGEIVTISSVEGIPSSKVSDIIRIKDGSGYYVATQNEGIFEVQHQNKIFKVTKITTNPVIDFSGIQSICEDSKSALYVATFGKGIVKLDFSKNRFENPVFYNTSTGFSTDNVKTIFEDREGNIWCGNYGTGLTQMVKNAFSFNPVKDERAGSNVSAILIRNNIRWVGTDNGVLKINHITGDILKFYSTKEGLPSGKITALYFSDDNNLWIGTEESGLWRMTVDKGKISPYIIAIGNLENSITAITGKEDQLWVGTKKGVCNIFISENKVNWFTNIKGGLPHNLVNYLFIDSKSRVWVATINNSVAFIVDGKVEKKLIPSERRVLSFCSIIEENDSTFWIASQGSGIFRIKGDSILNFTTSNGLLSDYCYSIIFDKNKHLWVTHRGGISKIRMSDFYIKPLQQYAGIKNNCEFNLNSTFEDDSNCIFFGTNQGILTYDPGMENSRLLPPPLNITTVEVNDEKFGNNSEIVLAPGNYKLKFEYLGINLKEPALVSYKYQLEGFDSEPDKTYANTVVYPHLGEGSYTFKIWAYSGDGIVSEHPATINILIKTPLWKHWWFYIILAILFQTGFILYHRKKERRYMLEKKVLEEKVLERTLELNQKNKELEKYQNFLEELVTERTLELVKEKNKAEESDRLKTAILNNISHEVRTPMNAICGFSKLLGEKTLAKNEKDDYIRMIDENAQSLLFLINDLLDLSLLESNHETVTNYKVDINKILLEFESQYSKKNSKNLDFEYVNKNENECLIFCDIEKLKQIISNLLNNAFKFTNTGFIKFGYRTFEKSIRFFVSDSGIGIEDVEKSKIFDLFHKAENHSKTLYRGAGVGLTVSKKLVEKMGGEIWVESEIHKGSVFYFTLPAESGN